MEPFDLVRLIGGFILSFAPVSQIWHTHKRRGAGDISYMWQFMIMTGLTMLVTYEYHYGLWMMYIPTTFEMGCITYLIGLKYYYSKEITVETPSV
jgi:hypothetical protein